MNKNYIYHQNGVKFCSKNMLVQSVLPEEILMHVNTHYEIFISHTYAPIQYRLNNTLFYLSAGDVIIVPPGIPHCSYMKVGEICVRHKIGIEETVLARFSDYSDILLSHTEKVFHLSDRTYRSCRNILDEMEKNTLVDTREAQCSLILQAISLLLYMQTEKNNSVPVNQKKIPQILQEILSWIQEDNRYLTLSGNREIAEHFHISENYIPRLFQLYYPIPLKKLILNMRIQYAVSQLQQGATVTEACYASGFTDCSHFIATFRKMKGVTPGKYAQQDIDAVSNRNIR